MRLDSGAVDVPVLTALDDEEADGVGVGAGRLADGLLKPLLTRATLDCEPVDRFLPS